MFYWPLMIAVALQQSVSGEDLPVLIADEPVVESLAPTDNLVDTGLRNRTLRAKRYLLELDEPGSWTVELHSHFFDAYLVLLRPDGTRLLEDDNGLMRTHARLVVNIDATEPSEPYLLDAGAIDDGTGRYTLTLKKGLPVPMSQRERDSAEIADARSGVQAAETELGSEHPTTLRAVSDLGLLLHYNGQDGEARSQLERALRLALRISGQEGRETAGVLCNLGLVVESQGQLKQAQQFHERAIAILEKSAGPENPDTAEAISNLAAVLYQKGDFVAAEEKTRRAIAIKEKTLGAAARSTLSSLNNLASVLLAREKLDEAIELLQRILPMLIETYGKDHGFTSSTMNNLAMALLASGRYVEGLSLARRALGSKESTLGPTHPETVICLHNLALLEISAGNTNEGRELLERALTIAEQVFGPEDPTTGKILVSLAEQLVSFGDLETAERIGNRALAITEKALGADHELAARSLRVLAQADSLGGKDDSAARLLERALRIYETGLGQRHHDTLVTQLELGETLVWCRSLARARELGERTLRIQEEDLGGVHPALARTLGLLTLVHWLTGDLQEALSLGLRERSIIEAVLGPDSPQAANCADCLGHIFAQIGDTRAAIEIWREALATKESQLATKLGSASEMECLRLASLQTHFAHHLLAPPGSQIAITPEESHEIVLRTKGRTLRSVLNVRDKLRLRVDSATSDLLRDLHGVQSSLSKALLSTPSDVMSASNIEALCRRKRDLEGKLDRLAGPMGTEDPRLQQVIDALKPDEAAIDFYVHEAWQPRPSPGNFASSRAGTGCRLSAWVIRGGVKGSQRIDLGAVAPIEHAVHELLASVRGESPLERGASLVTTRQGTESLCNRVRELLWDPLYRVVADARVVIVSPDSFLGLLPFEMIRDDAGCFLIEKRAFAYVQDLASLPSLLASRSEPLTTPSLLVAGGIDYEHWSTNKNVESAAPNMSTRGSLTPFRGRLGPWAPLPGTADEALSIRDLHRECFGDRAQCSCLLGSDVDESVLRSHLGQFQIVHVATHGFFAPESLPSAAAESDLELASESRFSIPVRTASGLLPGYLSGVVCAGANRATELEAHNDGLLTAEEMSWLDLAKVQIIVLSACDTGLGRPQSGEGMIGLRRSLRYAGAKTVISSLWKVNDEATVDLMRRLYRNLWQKKSTPLAALRQAQLSVIQEGGRPQEWAAFVLDGNWR